MRGMVWVASTVPYFDRRYYTSEGAAIDDWFNIDLIKTNT
jgi:hypothetical protein